MRTEPGCHLYCTACRLVLSSHFNITKLFNDHILFQEFVCIHWTFKFLFPLAWAWKQVFFSFWFFLYHYSDFWYCRSLLYYGKFFKKSGQHKNKLRTIHPENHENFMNGKPRLQFYWFLLKEKSVFDELRIKFYLHSYI